LSNEAGDALNRYQWPGNVRELKNAVEHAAVVSGGEQILPAHLPESVRQGRTSPGPTGRIQQIISEYIRALPADGEGLHAAAVKPLEKALLRHALETCRGNQSEAADLLGLHRNTLRRKLRELGIDARPAN